MSFNANVVRDLVCKALDEVYRRDSYLINNRCLAWPSNYQHASERSIVFRFGLYLHNQALADGLLADYDIDCEYNRNRDDIKRRGRGQESPAATPDLIVHRRGSNDHNILLLECKTHWSAGPRSNDVEKIRAFTDPSGPYKYRFGALIEFGADKPSVRWWDSSGAEVSACIKM